MMTWHNAPKAIAFIPSPGGILAGKDVIREWMPEVEHQPGKYAGNSRHQAD